MSDATLAPHPSASGRWMHVTRWTVQVMVAAAFLAAGGAKLAGVPPLPALFDQIGIGQWFRYVVGAVEITGAVLILIPRTAIFGAALLACTMACAVLTHLAVIGGNPAPAIVLLGLNLIVLWLRRGEVSAQFAR